MTEQKKSSRRRKSVCVLSPQEFDVASLRIITMARVHAKKSAYFYLHELPPAQGGEQQSLALRLTPDGSVGGIPMRRYG